MMLVAFRSASLAFTVLFLTLGLVFGQNNIPTNICGTVVNSTDATLNAVDVYNCLLTIPFRPDVARELLDYWRTTLEFQSTLAYLKDPPRSYQQPPIDLIRSLDLLRADIDAGVFQNQYSFETAFQDIIYAAHDAHIDFLGSIFGVFAFGAPFELATLSQDGISIPKVYMLNGAEAINGSQSFVPSPLATINGEVAEDFLALYASHNSFGNLEPHGDWNGIMFSAAGATQGSSDAFGLTNFYPGENITVVFENGTTYGPVPWEAYNIQAYGFSVNTGEDLYNYFVLGQEISSNDTSTDDDDDDNDDEGTADATSTTDPSTPTSTEEASSPTDTSSGDDTGEDSDVSDLAGWGGAYPNTADVVEQDLGFGGVLTGYFLNESKIGVLSIPSFAASGDSSATFSNTIGEFIKRSKQAGMTKIVIDLQQNGGGDQLLATDTFRQFFPSIDPFSGMRIRSTNTVNELGTTLTNVLDNLSAFNFSQELRTALIADTFAVTQVELNAGTNKNFTSWPEFFGPHPDRNDQFSTVFRYNLSNEIFDVQASEIVIYGYGNRSNNDPQPYDAKDIVLLTDSACSSTCDLFMEMMHHDAGVRTIVVGGLPQFGPMQARGGSRGGLEYTSDELDADFNFTSHVNSSLAAITPNRTASNITEQTFLTFNLADQIRAGEYTPVQFSYEGADCRIFWTPQTFNNMTALWLYAADAAFINASTCVAHSAEHNNSMVTDLWGPSSEQKVAWASSNPAWKPAYNTSGTPVSNLAQLQFSGPGVHEDLTVQKSANIGNTCKIASDCGNTNQYACRDVEKCVLSGNKFVQQKICRQKCVKASDCDAGFVCSTDKSFQGGKSSTVKFCDPRPKGDEVLCQKRVAQLTALPVQPTAAAAQPVDLIFN